MHIRYIVLYIPNFVVNLSQRTRKLPAKSPIHVLQRTPSHFEAAFTVSFAIWYFSLRERRFYSRSINALSAGAMCATVKSDWFER